MPEGTTGRIVLGIDTATVVCVGLAVDGRPVGVGQVADRMAHVEQLTPLVRQVCLESAVAVTDLTDVVVGLGPGPYTGLRVGIVTARVLAEIAGARLHGVCTLDVIAAEHAATHSGLEGEVVDGAGEFVVTTDARRKEVYWARYAPDGTRLEGPSVTQAEDVPRLPTIGPGTLLYPDRLQVGVGPTVLDPATLAIAGPLLADAGVEPLYLRRPDATEPGRRKSVLARRGPR